MHEYDTTLNAVETQQPKA